MSLCHEHTPSKIKLYVPMDEISIGAAFGLGSGERRAVVRICEDCGGLFLWDDDYKKKEKPPETVKGL